MKAPRLFCRLLLGAALGLAAGCGPESARPPSPKSLRPGPDEFSVMTYNLCHYAMTDQDSDGQPDDPKPEAERKAVIEVIASRAPDVLAVQEIGNPSVFEEFCFALRQAGCAYEHKEYLQRGGSEINLAVLSRFPIVSRQPHLDDEYSMGNIQLKVLRGFLDVTIQVRTNCTFRLLVAHLKSKVYHSLGQTEMRRNEARLLNKHVRRALGENPDLNLLVAGDLNDSPNSAALREVFGDKAQYLYDIRPTDADGGAWTHVALASDEYGRIDYLLASYGMKAELVRWKSHIVRDRQAYQASDHCPVLAVFKARDLPASAPGAAAP